MTEPINPSDTFGEAFTKSTNLNFTEPVKINGNAPDIGTPFLIDGFDGGDNLPLAELADAGDGTLRPATAVNIAPVGIGDLNVRLLISGEAENMDTSSWTEGTKLYLAEGTGLTDTAPIGFSQEVGVVTLQDASLGKVLFNLASRQILNISDDTVNSGGRDIEAGS